MERLTRVKLQMSNRLFKSDFKLHLYCHHMSLCHLHIQGVPEKVDLKDPMI